MRNVHINSKEVNNACVREAAEGPLINILEYTEDPIVSTDIISKSHSSIFDAQLSQVMDGNMVKIITWYDNEWAYSSRVEELIDVVGRMDGKSSDFSS